MKLRSLKIPLKCSLKPLASRPCHQPFLASSPPSHPASRHQHTTPASLSRHHAAPSYAHGTSTIPLLGQTIGDRLDQMASQFPDRESHVFSHQGTKFTFASLKEKAEAMAAGLMALGFRRGDRLGVWAPNCDAWVLTQFATAKAGIIQVNINPAYQLRELKYALNRVGCKGILATPSFKTQDYYKMLCEVAPELPRSAPGGLSSKDVPMLSHVIIADLEPASEKTFPGTLSLQDVVDAASAESKLDLEKAEKENQLDDAINLQFTSGTTGNPKGVILSHFNILNNAYQCSRQLFFHEHPSSLCVPVPLYHCFGMICGSLASLAHGTTCVFPSLSFEPGATLKSIHEERCTALYGTPTMFIDILNHPNLPQTDVTSLRTGAMAGSPCPIEIMRRVITDLHMPEVIIFYGLTETSPVVTAQNTWDDIETRVSTVGAPLPHQECKVVDLEGRVVPRGEKGELCVRGYNTMHGYWDDEAKTREAIGVDKWFWTGDVAIMNEKGYISIAGRAKDLIIRGGENIYPVEVEQFLHTHPKIADVYIFGVPDDRMGEEVCAWIKVTSGEELSDPDVRAFCKGQISHFKIPRHIRFVDEFPLTVTGKVQKFKMAEAMVEELKGGKNV